MNAPTSQSKPLSRPKSDAPALQAASVDAVLSKFNFSASKPPRKAQEGRSSRQIVLDFIDTQIAIAENQLGGKPPYTVSKTRFVKDDQGKSHKTQVLTTPRAAFWQDHDGFVVQLKYGNTPFQFGEGKNSVVAGSNLADVPATLRAIREAVVSGGFDPLIEKTRAHAKRQKGSGTSN